MRWSLRSTTSSEPDGIERVLRDCERWRQWHLPGVTFAALALALMGVLHIGLGAVHRDLGLVEVGAVEAMIGGLVGGVWGPRLWRRGRDLARKLASIDDASVLDSLIDTLAVVPHRTQPEVAVALARLLHGLDPARAARIDGLRRRLLEATLSLHRPSARGDTTCGTLVAAILHALVVMDDVEAIPNIGVLLKKTTDPELRAAAESALAALTEIEQKATARDTLLRPADPDQDAATLLRPAGPGETDAELLLRAAQAPGDADGDA